jgi:hypothetical protein
MTFSNEAALKAALVAAATTAVSQVEKRVHSEFTGNLNQYYGEFTPAEYIRTGALMGSLETTGTMPTGSGASAEIYFTTPSYQTGLVPLQSGRMGYATWSGGQVLDSAMHGSHGGYTGGTAIWDDSMASLGNIEALLIQAIKAQGL